ncbi:unnamed protein product [Brassica rapa]|uniref:peptidylprolyl isomerase n=1 Tax=Brassica campestris TaxID=3711 RepID=A0A8D9H4A8_BRACM|nr:unnamed protein product [Brassica rapa]
MELCVISSINPFHSSSTRRLGSRRLFQSDSLFLSRDGCSVLRFDGRLLKKPIKPLELSCAAKKIGGGGGGVRRSAASTKAAPAVEPSVKEDKLPAELQVKEIPAPNSSVKLSVEVPAVVCEDCYQRVLTEFMKMAKVPGFRPGKRVPENIIVGFVGRPYVLRATVESILKRTLPHAMESVTGKALKDSIQIVSSFPEMEKAYSQLKTLSYEVVVDVVPELKWNPENGYKDMKVVVELGDEIDAKKACERQLRQKYKSLGALKIVTDRGLEVGDLAVIDISATTIDEDGSTGEAIPDAESKGFHFDTEEGNRLLPGFLDSILGIKAGESKSFSLVFPESWKQETLRGQRAQFTVDCKELFYRDLPTLDDSLADKLLPGCTTLKEVEETLTKRCQEMEEEAKEQATDNAILEQIRKMVEVEIPQSLFEEQGRQFYGARLLEIQASGNMKLTEDQLASLSSQKSVNEFLETQRESITNIIKQNLAVGDIFKRENLEFSTDELVKEVENSVTEFKKHKQEYDEERVKDQEIWDEVGESDEQRDKMLLQIEQECLDVYKRKVEQAAKSRAELLQTLSDANAELSSLTTSLGEKTFANGIPDKSSGTIKEQLAAIAPALEQLWQQKEERVRAFSDVQSQIQKISGEIAGGLSNNQLPPIVDESDLSLKKLDSFHSQLQELQKEKSDRLHKVLEFVSTVHDLCAVLALDFLTTVTQVHPSLDEETAVQAKSISNDTLSMLSKTVLTLEDDKKQRLRKLQELATQLVDLWNLMDTPDEERDLFNHVTCNISSSVDDVTSPGALARDLINQAEVEVDRLDQLKASRMKEIAFKKQSELEEIYARAHVEINPESARERIMSLIDAGNVEHTELLADMDSQIAKAREEAVSRKDVLDRVEKWMSACEEESWLEDYNRDHNRYSSSRGAHLNLKRAEKARILVSKIPTMVDTLVAKIRAWEEEHSMSFAYDGVPLLAMLDEYGMLRQEREDEKRRLREQKKVQEQPHVEQDSAFSTRPSTAARPVSAKKPVGTRANNGGANRRLSLNANQNGSRSVAKEGGRRESLNKPAAPANYVAISKEEAAASSPVSGAADQVSASP